MHFCADELMAIMAAVPCIGFCCLKCRELYHRWRGRSDHSVCIHRDE